MKVYYKEDQIYPATYNFKDDTTGAFPEGWTDADGADCETTIIASFDSHKKVLQMYDNGVGTRAQATINITQGLNTEIEFWLTRDSIAADTVFYMWLYEGATRIIYLMFIEDDLRYNDGAWKDVKLGFLVANTLSHFKIVLDDTANTFDCYIDGVLEKADAGYENNSGSGVDSIIWRSDNTDTGYYIYLDALGISTDTNYIVGDNRFDDYHYYSRTQLTDIVEYPTITSRNNMYGLCSLTLRDFEGALYSTWYSKNFTEFVIEDDDDNILFRGYLINKKFGNDYLKLFLAGIGIKLEWAPFFRNYVLAGDDDLGKVRVVPGTSILTMYNDLNNDDAYAGAGEDFTWAVDQWITDQDVGLLLVDNSNTIDTTTWEASAIAQTGGTLIAGDADSLDAANDGDIYSVSEDAIHWDCIITPVMGDSNIVTTKTLHKIIIKYSFRFKKDPGTYDVRWIFEIMKDGVWVVVWDHPYRVFTVGEYVGVSNEYEVPDSTSLELAKYLTVDGANWDELQGCRIRFINTGISTSEKGYCVIDKLLVDVQYEAYDIAAIMEPITDSAASTITCSSIVAWDVTGVDVNDIFKIGQNTIQIVSDISEAAGIDIFVVGQTVSGGGTQALYPNGDWVSNSFPTHSDSGGDGSHFKDIDEVVVDPNAGDGNYIRDNGGKASIDIFDMENFAVPANEVVTKLELKIYHKNDIVYIPRVNIYTTSTGWIEEQYPVSRAGYTWDTFTWDNLALSTADMTSLQIKFSNTQTLFAGSFWYIDSAYVIATHGIYSPFTKFIARKFRGTHGIDGIEAIGELEGAVWCEDYVNNRIKLLKPENYESSGVFLTELDYGHDWEYEDKCNQVRRVDVFGSVSNSDYPIHEYAIDNDIEGNISKQIINERIMTSGDAMEIATAQLALLKTKRPSLKLTLDGTYPNLQLGKTVNVTLARPTVSTTDYKIRMIERYRRGNEGIKTVVYCGLGETADDERIGMTIRKIGYIANRAMSDRLI